MNNISTPEHPFVSVIIPVFNDAERLKICLEALEGQTYPRNSFEVVIVDNGSKEDIQTIIEQFQHAVMYSELQTGSYAARNKGISVSRGEIIAFTDSDCIPAIDWIEKGVKSICMAPDCGFVTGKVDMFYKNEKHLTAAELYEKVYAFDQENNVKRKKFGVTANLFTRKEVFVDVGFFNSTLKSGGDLEWGNRVSESGYELIYSNDVCVKHPARHSLIQLCKKRVRIRGGLKTINKEAPYTLNYAIKDLMKIKYNTIGLIKRFSRGLPPSDKLTSVRDKFLLIFTVALVRMILIFEKVRLQIGGRARR